MAQLNYLRGSCRTGETEYWLLPKLQLLWWWWLWLWLWWWYLNNTQGTHEINTIQKKT